MRGLLLVNNFNGRYELSKYRLENANQTYKIAKICYQNEGYKDAVNRSYYAVFYACFNFIGFLYCKLHTKRAIG